MDVNGHCALVTGGGSGLGEATVRLLAAKGAKIAILDRDIEKAKAVAASVGGIAIACDVVSAEQVEAAVADVVEKMGVPRVLVNSAGVGTPKRILGKAGPQPLSDFARVVEINLIGTFNVLRVVSDVMSKTEPLADGERGVIVNVASVAAYDGQVGQAAYAASKGGVASLTLPAARELARFGIRVTAIAPGLFLTPLMDILPPEVQASVPADVPFPKRLGRADEFAALVMHMVENVMLNGEVVRLDGALRLKAG